MYFWYASKVLERQKKNLRMLSLNGRRQFRRNLEEMMVMIMIMIMLMITTIMAVMVVVMNLKKASEKQVYKCVICSELILNCGH
jgi:hypothetical protein